MPKKLIEIDRPEEKSRKSLMFKLLFVLVNVITITIILVLEFRKGEIIDFSEAMAVLNRNIHWFFLALGVFGVKFLADSMSYYVLIRDTTGESRLPLAMKVCLIGRYGDGITPMGTGGQPFQIYYLHKYNIEIPKAASIPLARVVVKIIGYNLTMLIFFVFFSQDGSTVVKSAAFFALFVNSFQPFIILFFAFNRPLGLKITDMILKLGHRFKLIKDYEKAKNFWLKRIDEMLVSIRYFSTRPAIFFTLLVFAVLEMLCMASIPYLVYRVFGGDGSITWVFMATSTMYVISASIIAPTPGTSGVAEASFYAIFERVIMNGLLFYALITWRIITFYTFIVGGFILLIYESVYKKKLYVDDRDERKGRITNRQRKWAQEDKEQAEREKAERLLYISDVDGEELHDNPTD